MIRAAMDSTCRSEQRRVKRREMPIVSKIMNRRPGCLLVCGLLLSAGICPAWESTLYGPGWQATPALSFEEDKIVQDFSFAGYRRGEVPLPVTPPGLTYNAVTTYGADPTGAVDSTVAIQSAINAAAAAGGGIVWLPAGLYKISPQGTNTYCLQINASGVVLRGAGTGQTFLLNTQTVMRDKNIISVTGPSSAAWTTVQSPSTNITTDLPGPVTEIPVVSVAGFAVGDHILVRADPGDAWATEHLEDGWVGHAGSYGRLMYLRQIMALDAVNNVITLDIPTRYTLKTRDNARIYKKTTLITEVGLEGFSVGNVQHPGTTGWGEEDYATAGTSAYDVHNSYVIRMSRARDGWIKNVHTYQPAGNTTTCHLLNNGILLSECSRVTVKGCYFRRPQFGGGGGAGYMYRLQNSGDCLVRDSTAEFCRHGFVFSHMSTSGNVLHACLDKTTGKQTGNTGNQNTSGKGSDHHMHFSHSNLVDACTADGSWFEARYRPFGSVPLHNLTAAHTVYWNTEGKGTAAAYVVHSQQSRFGYVIGTRGTLTAVNTGGTSTTKTTPVDHVEGTAQGDTLTPFSLFREQRRRRIGLPTVAEMAETQALFPNNTALVTPQVWFGDSTTAPPDAAFTWARTSGPGAADLQSAGGFAVNAAFLLPGAHTLTLTVSRHGSLEEDWAASAPATVRVLPAGTVETELPPVADAHVQEGTADANYNTTVLWMKYVGSSNPVNREIFMRFDLSSLAGRTVQSAELRLNSTEPDTAATGQTHFVANDTWSEAGITWNTRPAVSTLLQTWPLATDYAQRIDLTAGTTAEAAGDGLLSLRHSIQSQTNSATVFKYASREHATTALRPRLRVLHSEVWPSFTAWISGFPQIPAEFRDADDDPDGDGVKNLEEYARRAQPHLAEALPAGLLAAREGGALRLRVPGGASVPPGVYPVLEHNAGLSPAGWQALMRVSVEVSGADLVFTVPSGLAQAGPGFFRLRYEAVP
ncbi:MAG TPA: hypothetical protein DIT13_01940 [Verrucomicrobiales bacterium]|nr:hypothetical protein [Verrucomicrobiales bacterium]